MSVVDLSHISEYYRNKVKCVNVKTLATLNSMLKNEWVVSVYHHDISNMLVYYIDDGCQDIQPTVNAATA